MSGSSVPLGAIGSERPTPATPTLDARLVWVGKDDRGIELEIVALDLPDAIVVIHVMPRELRR